MNVKQMKELIADLPDDMKFYAIIGDHEAVEVSFEDWFVSKYNRNHYSQFYSKDALGSSETMIRALVCND